MSLGNGASITLFHADGTVLARYPHSEAVIGRRVGGNGGLLSSVADGAVHTALVTSPFDDLDKIAAGARVSRFPLTITATRTIDDALADWRSQVVLLVGAATLAAGVIAVMFSLMIRQILRQNRIARQRLEGEKQRVETALDNMTQGLISFDADACVVMFNRRFIDMLGLSTDVIRPGVHLTEVIAHCKA